MNSFIETLNQWGGNFLSFAWPMLWQSSLLIVVLLAFDFLFRRKLWASIRYALWLVVLVKLCVPPALALPTSPAWWLHKISPSVAAKAEPRYTVTYDNAPLPEIPQASLPAFVPPKPAMMNAAWLLVFSISISAALLVWLLVRWWQITRQVRRAATSERLAALADEAQKFVGMKFKVQVKLTANTMSPAVCGLFRPAILIPQSLAENFSDEQLRAVLLHELIHLRRRDVWLNFFQALLQIFYWWHPLVWLANARIRRVREEAVDDAVMLALRDEAEAYAPTLLEVAKLALNRPLASLGLVGILESRHALRQRIERLVDFRPPRQAGLTLVSLLGILAFTAVAVPMGEGPAPVKKPSAIATPAIEEQSLTVKVNPEIFIRNVKAQAGKYLLAPTNDYTDILLEALRSEGLDCNPPHGLAFNTKTGEITMQNTPDKLEVFRLVIEQLNRADGICELPLHNPPFRKKLVVIQARIYEMRDVDFQKFTPGLGFYQGSHGDDSWWSVAPEKFDQLIGNMESSGLNPIQRPRIQTSSGMPAQFFVGNENNNVEFDCIPFVMERFVDLTLQSTVVTGQPAKSAFTNQFNIKASAEDHGGIVVRMENFDGHAGSNLVVVIGVQIITNGAPPHFQQRLQAIIKRADGTNQLADGNSTNRLFTRTFKVDTNAFVAALRKQTGLQTNTVSAMARSLFSQLGLDLESPPGKSVFYGDRLGMLFVKATASDLDTIERAIQALNYVAPMIHIKARFLEVPQKTFQDLVRPNLLTNDAVKSGTNTGPDLLTNEKFKTVLRALEQRDGVEALAEPDVTTISGRQTQMRATQIINVVTNFALQENGTNVSVFPQTEKVETGPVLDVVPYVLSDGYTINLALIPSLTEFLGYDQPTNTTPVYTSAGEKINLPKALPNFRVRQAVANVNLWDNQTVVIGGMPATSVLITKDQVPILGDLPLIGRLFQSQSKTSVEKELLVFITATIVDPAGNRIRSDADLPFAPTGIPPQPRKPK